MLWANFITIHFAMKLNKIYYFLTMIALVMTGCDQKSVVRVYEDINTPAVEAEAARELLPQGHPPIDQGMNMNTHDPQMQAMLAQSVSDVPLIWQTPIGWNEEKGSGMRLVTFKTDDADSITCTVVSLSGSAGGLESNIIRWMKQINLAEDQLSGDKMQNFIQKQESLTSKGHLTVQLIDLTSLSDSKNYSDQTILGAVVHLEDTTIFIKMSGTLQAVNQNREEFKALCQSLAINE